MADEEDQRPSASLFENPSVQVCFNDGGRLFVPGSLFHDYPVLRPAGEWPRRDVELDDLTRDVGHVLFYYLLTGSYECVKPKGVSRQERLVNELTTGVGVHNASRKYNLPALPEKAKAEVERLAKVLPFPQVLNLLRNLQLSPGVKEAWLDELVQNGLKNIFKNPAAYLEDTATQVDSDGIMFSNLILKNLATLLVNGVVPGRADDAAAISTPPPEPAEIEEEFLPKGPSSAPSENEPEAVPESQITDQPLVSEPELEAESEPVPDTEDPHTEQAKLESVPEIEHTEQEVAPESSEAKAEAATEAPTGEAKAGEVSEPAQEANATTESEEAVESPAASPAAVSPTEGGIFPATGKMVKKKRRSLFSFDSASSTKEEPVTAADSTTPEPVLNRTQSGLRRIRYLGR